MKRNYLYILILPFVGATGFALLKPVIPIWVKEISGRSLYAGLAASFFMIGRAIMAPLGGMVHDRGVPLKKLILFSLGGSTAIFLLFPLFNSTSAILFLNLIWGVMSGLLWPQLQLFAGRSSEGMRMSRNLTLYYMAGVGGVATGNGILGFVVPFFSSQIKLPQSYRFVAFISFLLYLVIFLILIFKKTPQIIERKEVNKRTGWWSILFIPSFFAGFIFEIIRSIYLIYLKESMRMDMSSIGKFLMMAGLLGMLFSYPLSLIADRKGVEKVVILPIFLYGIGSIMLPLIRSIPLVFVVYTILRIAQSSFLPLSRSFIIGEGGEMGTRVGFLNTAMNLGSMVGPVISGFFYDIFAARSILLSFLPVFISGIIFILTGVYIWGSISRSE